MSSTRRGLGVVQMINSIPKALILLFIIFIYVSMPRGSCIKELCSKSEVVGVALWAERGSSVTVQMASPGKQTNSECISV